METSTFYLDDSTTIQIGSATTTNTNNKIPPLRNKKTSLQHQDSQLNEISPDTSLPTTSSNITPYDMTMQDFLEQARNGNVIKINELIESTKSLNQQPSITFDINYKGKPKRFYGWTALHISCYFNHIDIVKLLIQVIIQIKLNNFSKLFQFKLKLAS